MFALDAARQSTGSPDDDGGSPITITLFADFPRVRAVFVMALRSSARSFELPPRPASMDPPMMATSGWRPFALRVAHLYQVRHRRPRRRIKGLLGADEVHDHVGGDV